MYLRIEILLMSIKAVCLYNLTALIRMINKSMKPVIIAHTIF